MNDPSDERGPARRTPARSASPDGELAVRTRVGDRQAYAPLCR
ncbi:hypothetical protein [Streptodolium elevatio]|uniref:Uncharacterized protein n=1 Tax=Streptodolium elevatio TaxID=3157996 RepID=A0ABV3DND9_9ACTN